MSCLVVLSHGSVPALKGVPCHIFFQSIWRATQAGLCSALIAIQMIVLAAAIVYADETIQEWIPDVLLFPEDTEVVMDRAVGSTVWMFSIATGTDTDALLAKWEESLNMNGYPVTQAGGEVLERSIEFSGPGILNAKILVAPRAQDGRSIIEFDATLN